MLYFDASKPPEDYTWPMGPDLNEVRLLTWSISALFTRRNKQTAVLTAMSYLGAYYDLTSATSKYLSNVVVCMVSFANPPNIAAR